MKRKRRGKEKKKASDKNMEDAIWFSVHCQFIEYKPPPCRRIRLMAANRRFAEAQCQGCYDAECDCQGSLNFPASPNVDATPAAFPAAIAAAPEPGDDYVLPREPSTWVDGWHQYWVEEVRKGVILQLRRSVHLENPPIEMMSVHGEYIPLTDENINDFVAKRRPADAAVEEVLLSAASQNGQPGPPSGGVELTQAQVDQVYNLLKHASLTGGAGVLGVSRRTMKEGLAQNE